MTVSQPLCIHVEYIPSIRDQEMKLVRPRSTSFSSNSSTWEPYSASFKPIQSYPRIPIRIILVFDEHIDIPNLVLLRYRVPTELPRTVFPTIVLPMGVHINFVQDVPRDLQWLDHDFGHLCRGGRINVSGQL